jgi:hypothetical protein
LTAFSSRLTGDVNDDGKVDMGDIVLTVQAFGSTMYGDGSFRHSVSCPTCPHSPSCNLAYDTKIDMGDIIIALREFAQHYY